MFAAGKTAGASAGTPDAQFNYVTMLLHGDGTNGAQNNTFLDSSTNNFTITRNGNTTQGSFSPYGTNWSNYVDGSTDFIYCTPSDLTGQYTIEGWFCADDYNTAINRVFFGNWTTGFLLRYNSGSLEFYSRPGGSTVSGSASVALNPGQWHHMQATRDSSNVQRVFVDGVLKITTATGSGTITMTNFCIGAENTSVSGTADQFKGYISNFRILNGTCLNTSNFTPPTQPLTAITNTSLLTCQSNRFIDNSTNNYTITVTGTPSVQRFNPFGTATAYSTSVIGGSGYFDGSGDYLTVADNAALDVDAGSFTMEAWVYLTDATVTSPILAKNFGSAGGWMLWVQSTLRLRMYDASAGQVTATSSASLISNSWNHVAATRSSNTLTVYVNGVSSGTATFTGTSTNAAVLEIGGYGAATAVSTGYISDARLVKGSVVYTGNFTPPTAPLTAITNTSLLTNMTNGAIFDNAMINDLETVDGAQISTSVVKYGTGSLKFDGAGDSLKGIANSPSFQFGTGDFTIEMWVYTANLSAFQTLVDTRPSDTQSAYGVFINSSAFPSWYDASGFSTSSVAVSSNTWTHVAVSRASGTLRVFVNGTSGFSGSNTNAQNPTGNMVVGMNISGSAPYNGYIDDLRITNGYARYTATFTPPTAAFPNTGPT